MNESHHSNHDDPLERATRAYHSESVPEGPPSGVVAEVLAALHDAEETAGKPETVRRREPRMGQHSNLGFRAEGRVLLAGLYV